MFGMRKPLRKLVTGDGDVRVRDYMSDSKLRKAMQPSNGLSTPHAGGSGGSGAKDTTSQDLVVAGSQNSSDNGDTVLGDDDAASVQGPGQSLKFQVSCRGCRGLSWVVVGCRGLSWVNDHLS